MTGAACPQRSTSSASVGALLVVRSLLDGAKRYGDLQRELGAPTNILASRLRELLRARGRRP